MNITATVVIINGYVLSWITNEIVYNHNPVDNRTALISLQSKFLDWLSFRLKININNTAELLTCGDGSAIYVTSKGKNDFVAHRELLLSRTPWCQTIMFILRNIWV